MIVSPVPEPGLTVAAPCTSAPSAIGNEPTTENKPSDVPPIAVPLPGANLDEVDGEDF